MIRTEIVFNGLQAGISDSPIILKKAFGSASSWDSNCFARN